MNNREKRLLFVVAAVVGLFVVVLGGRVFFLKPLREIDKKTGALREKLGEAESGTTRLFRG